MPLQLSEEEWKKRLTPEQYHILREAGDEMPFTGTLYQNHDTGEYRCAACGQVVFSSDTKFDSGSGWPSFYAPTNNDAVHLVEDNRHGMHRIEVRCANCDSHLGHVFNDAYDQPTGMRFCIVTSALDFEKKD